MCVSVCLHRCVAFGAGQRKADCAMLCNCTHFECEEEIATIRARPGLNPGIDEQMMYMIDVTPFVHTYIACLWAYHAF
jgi:hypothetical protein